MSAEIGETEPCQPVDQITDPSETVSMETEPSETENGSTGMDRAEILSKRKQKKILKLAKWEQVKKEKRARERLKAKEKRIADAAKGIPGPNKLRKALKRNKMEDSKNPVRVAIDFDYDELMIDKDISKCAKQLLRVYTVNRKSMMPIRLYYTSLKEKGRIVEALRRNDGYENWDIYLKQESYLDIFDRDSIVYLTSDSDNVLTELDPKAVYIIGGLVDHNHHKGLSLERAQQNGLKTARLPLSENISIKTRTVLTIVHVFELLLAVSEGKSWKDALLEILPQRKFKPPGARRNKNKAENDESSSEELSELEEMTTAEPEKQEEKS